MNCGAFERWLDAGMPDPGSDRALAHAAGCRVCAPALAEARALEAALRGEAARPAVGPGATDFVNAVMARVEAEGMPARVNGDRFKTIPLWLRLFADPVSAVSVTLAGLIGCVAVLKPEWIAASAAAILAFGNRAGEGLAAWPLLSRPSPAALAAAAALAPVLALFCVPVYRTFERAVILMAGSRRR